MSSRKPSRGIDRTSPGWPEDVEAIYQEIAEEDRCLADAMFPGVRETWPLSALFQGPCNSRPVPPAQTPP
jgi:hypothetical protein